MLSRRLRPYAWMLLVASVLLIAYCFIAIAAVASLSVAPNYPGDARHDALVCETALLVAAALGVVCITILVLTRRRQL
jgi:hypothetical protein